MPDYVRVIAETGEMHERNCGVCGYMSVSGTVSDEELAEFKAANAAEGHILVEVTTAERDQLVEIGKSVIRGGERVEVPHDENIFDVEELLTEEISLKYKVDVGKARTDIKSRDKVDVPIEINVVGGKEIIGYVTMPEGIVVAIVAALSRAK